MAEEEGEEVFVTMGETVQNIYQCAVCLKQFSRKSTCKSHMKLHTGECTFECTTCAMTFANKSNLNSHMLTHTRQKCNVCGKTFTSKPLLKSHMIMHTTERPHECNICGRRFKRKGELRSHNVTHTGEKRFKCEVCGNLFTERHSLKTHMRCHTGEKPFKCSVCGKDFSRKSSYTAHSRMHTGVQPYKCFVCGKKFAHRSVMVSHSKKHMIRECTLCGMNFMKEKELTNHIREQHHENWPHGCNICGQLFSNSTKVRKHMKIHTVDKPHQCNICSRQFLHKSLLDSHVLSHSDGDGRHTCKVCGKSYTAKLSLQIHMRGHTGEKPFMCSVCGKQFTRKSGCVSHMRRHTGEKPYSCNVCGKQFGYSSGLRSHMRRHNRPECNLCGVKLIGGIDPNKHVTHSIVAVGAKCNLCDIVFKSLSLFKSHLVNHSVAEREEECQKNANTMGISLAKTGEETNEEDLLQHPELKGSIEEQFLDKRIEGPGETVSNFAMLEGFPMPEEDLPVIKVSAKKGKHTKPKVVKVKQETVEFDDQEFINSAILEITKSSEAPVNSSNFDESENCQSSSSNNLKLPIKQETLTNGIDDFASEDYVREKEGRTGSMQSMPFSPGYVGEDSQNMDYDDTSASPLREIDSFRPNSKSSTVMPVSFSVSSSKSMNIQSSIHCPPSQIEGITVSDREYVTECSPDSRKIITIFTSSPGKSPNFQVESLNENDNYNKISVASFSTRVCVGNSIKSPNIKVESLNKNNLDKTSVSSVSTSVCVVNSGQSIKDCDVRISPYISSNTSPGTTLQKETSSNNLSKPVIKINTNSELSKRHILVNANPKDTATATKKICTNDKPNIANSYSAYIKKMLNLIKPAEKQMTLIKALNKTMDEFIEKYQSWT